MKQTEPKYFGDSNQSVTVERNIPPIDNYNTIESIQKSLNPNEFKMDYVNQRVSYTMPYFKLNNEQAPQVLNEDKFYRSTHSIQKELDHYSEAEIYNNKLMNKERSIMINESSSRNNPIASSKKFSMTKSRYMKEIRPINNRLEESKKKIEQNKHKTNSSPKRFYTEGSGTSKLAEASKIPMSSLKTLNKSTRGNTNVYKQLYESRLPKKSSNESQKIKSMVAKDLPITPDGKKVKKNEDESKNRKNNFRSPNAIRKVTPLQSKQNNLRLMNNISATRTGRRSRGERKENDQTNGVSDY